MLHSAKCPRWKQLIEESVASNLQTYAHAKTVQLATLDVATKRPRNRSVVARGFLFDTHSSLETDLLLITTDARTPKLAQFQADNSVELCWWLPVTGEQYRLSGRVHFLASKEQQPYSSLPHDLIPAHIFSRQFTHSDPNIDTRPNTDNLAQPLPQALESERLRLWRDLTPLLRASFLYPPPGEPFSTDYNDKEVEKHHFPKELAEDQEEEALKQFVLLLVEVEQVDWVKLWQFPPERRLFTRGADGSWKEERVNP
ncbi:uncharacterized protein VTP21DRAFT_9520 [Calcarisporiella thermophila]|uniref:uncharacterized protein n=1 Tax=Calcarisporiella thermophila TaxID=911321 RepID=UPI0037442DD5